MAAAGKEGLSFLQEFVQGFLFLQSKFLADTAASGVDAGTGDAQGQRDLVRALLQVDQHAEQFVGFGQFWEVLTQAGQEEGTGQRRIGGTATRPRRSARRG